MFFGHFLGIFIGNLPKHHLVWNQLLWTLNLVLYFHRFRKSPQLRTWSACGPNWWIGPHLRRISYKRPHFPNYERKVAVKLWKRAREMSIRLRTRVKACITWQMGLCNLPTLKKNICTFVAKCAFWRPFGIWTKIMTLQHPWAILFFYDTNNISRYFNMMQYIAIFSLYFLVLNWSKICVISFKICPWSVYVKFFAIKICDFSTKMTYLMLFCKTSALLKL